MTGKLRECPFCGKAPVRVSIGTASCDGLIDGREVHNTIGMRPECWNARTPGTPRSSDDGEVERLLSDWQAQRSEWHGPVTLEVVREYATWRETRAPSDHLNIERSGDNG